MKKWIWLFYWIIILGCCTTTLVFSILTVQEDMKGKYYINQAKTNLERANCYLNNGSNCGGIK